MPANGLGYHTREGPAPWTPPVVGLFQPPRDNGRVRPGAGTAPCAEPTVTWFTPARALLFDGFLFSGGL